MILNTNLINMNKDQDLIFEAYTKSLTEDWQKGTSKAPKGKSFDMSRGGAPSNVDAARDGSGGRYRKTRPPSAQSNKTHSEMEEEKYENDALMVNGDEYIVQAEISGDDVEITTLFKYDEELDDHNEIDLGSIPPQLRQDIEDSVLKNVHSEDNEDLGNTDYDVEEPSVFERLEELMNSKPELKGVLTPILLDFENALMEIDKIDINNFDAQEVFTSLARLYPF
jgi:hypothetical protein